MPIEEAKRFGIVITDENRKILDFEEKPDKPRSNLASMGIYIFNRKKLAEYLTADENTPGSSNDFGKNIIPNMLAAGEKMFAYPFQGYWKDVGTISSLWEANMDLLGQNPELNLGDESWRIYARHQALSPQYVGKDAVIENSNISEGCEIYGTVRNCIVGAGVKVEAGAVVTDSVLMGDTVIGEGAVVSYSNVATGVNVGKDAKIGADKAEAKGIAVIGEDITIEAGAVVEAGAMVPEV